MLLKLAKNFANQQTVQHNYFYYVNRIINTNIVPTFFEFLFSLNFRFVIFSLLRRHCFLKMITHFLAYLSSYLL